MSDLHLTTDSSYQALVDRISAVYAHGQLQAHRAVNEHLTRTFWQIGHDIVEFEQGGQTRAAYCQALIKNLSRDLRLRHGKGFSRSNVIRARQIYLAYPKGATLSHLLSWSHRQPAFHAEIPALPPRPRGTARPIGGSPAGIRRARTPKSTRQRSMMKGHTEKSLCLVAELHARFSGTDSVIRRFRTTANAGRPNETSTVLANPPFNDSETTLRGSAFPQREVRPLVVSKGQDNFHVGWHTGEYDSNRKRSWH